MHLETKIIETNRLILRPFIMEDAVSVYENWTSDPEAAQYMSWPVHQSVDDAVEYLTGVLEGYAKAEKGDWAITRKDTGTIIGSIGAYPKNERAKSVNAGYIIGKPWWRQGYTSEAFRAVIGYLFRETEVLRIEAFHDSRNVGSGGVMRKCGLQYEGTSRAAELNNLGVYDAVRYAILRTDWERESASCG